MKRTNALKVFREHYLLILYIFLFSILKISYLFKPQNVIWDEAVYIGMGKYIFSFGKVGLWEIIRPIGLPILFGGIWKLGLNPIICGKLIALLFSIGTIILVYLIGCILVDKRVGLVASIILSTTSIFYLHSLYLLTEIPSTFFILLGFYKWLKNGSPFLVGIYCGIGAIFKFPQVLMAIVILAGIFFYAKRKSQSIIFLSGFVAVHLPYVILNWVLYNKDTSFLYHALFRPWLMALSHQFNPAYSVISGSFLSHIYNIFYYIIELIKENTLFLLLLPGIWILAKKKILKKKEFFLVCITFCLYIAYFTFISNKQTRFLIAFLPYAALITAYGFFYIFTHAKRDRVRIFFVLFVVVSVAGVVSRNLTYYDLLYDEEPPIVRDYYTYFNTHNVSRIILTTDPLPAAYVDKLFEPFYYSVDVGSNIYSMTEDKADAAIFSPESFYCPDKECKQKLLQFQKTIEEDNYLVFSQIYYDRAYYIYLNNDLK